jgi:hypothetical protein
MSSALSPTKLKFRRSWTRRAVTIGTVEEKAVGLRAKASRASCRTETPVASYSWPTCARDQEDFIHRLSADTPKVWEE